MNMIKRHMYEHVFMSPHLRMAFNAIFRHLVREENDALKDYIRRNSSKNLIAVNIGYPTYMEHLRDLVGWLDKDEKAAPLLIGPARWPERKYKADLFRYLEERYHLRYGRDVFPYLALSCHDAGAFIEPTITVYGHNLKCPKIIYAHGMGGLNMSKDMRHVRYLHKYDALFLTGPLQRRALTAAQKRYGGDLPEMYEVGYLRGDRMQAMSRQFNRIDYLDKLGLPDAKTVLYAPTWGDFSSVMEWFDTVVDTCESIGVNLLLRLHPMMITGDGKAYTCGIDWEKKLQDAQRDSRNVRAVMGHDLDGVMLASDVMVTDASGLALEYMTMDKPVVFLPAPRYFRLYGEERPMKWVRPEREITGAREFMKELDISLSGRGSRYPIDQIVYNSGHALEKMVEAVGTVTSRNK